MTEEYRQMWLDLYRFFEMASKTDPKTPAWQKLGTEAMEILKKHNGNYFMQDVLAETIGYWATEHENRRNKA